MLASIDDDRRAEHVCLLVHAGAALESGKRLVVARNALGEHVRSPPETR